MRKTTEKLALLALAMALVSPISAQQPVPVGITEPVVLEPFVGSEALCNSPSGLEDTLVFAQDNEREFMEGVGFGLSEAAADRGLAYSNMLAQDNPARMIEQIEELSSPGAVVVAPVEPRSLAPSLQSLIAGGTYVGAVVPPPAVTILNAPQYLTGQTLANEAARYIVAQLEGHANVVLLTHDSLQFLAPRFRAMRDVLSKLPGVTIVADISPSVVNEDGGYATMKTILLAQPDIDVVLGADTVVLGALRALQETGKATSAQFLGGIDGEPDAVAAIRAGGPYKATVSLAPSIFGYALGQFAADWLEGRVVPQAIDVLPTLLTPDNIEQYQSDLRNPAQVWNDPQRRDSYLRFYGNICYDSRDEYLNFPWSSEGS